MTLVVMNFLIFPPAVKHLTRQDGKVDLQLVEAMYDEKIAADINRFPGFIRKVWSVSENGRTGCGVYLFDTRVHADLRIRYAHRFYTGKGMLFTRCRAYEVMENISALTHAELTQAPAPELTEEQITELFAPIPKSSIREKLSAMKQRHDTKYNSLKEETK